MFDSTPSATIETATLSGFSQFQRCVAALGLFAAAALPLPALAADGLGAITRQGTLRVCTSVMPPYAMKDAKGQWTGHEIDIAKRLASDMGVRAVVIEKPFAQLIPTLAGNGCDIIAASLSIEPNRLRLVWFSRPYSESEVRIVIKRGAAGSLRDLDKPEVTLAAVGGTVAVDATRVALPTTKIEQFRTLAEARQALDAGSVAGLVGSTPVPTLLTVEAPDAYRLVDGAPLLRTAEAFAVRKGASDLLNFVDGWIELRRRDGFLERTASYWLTGLQWVKRVQPGAAK